MLWRRLGRNHEHLRWRYVICLNIRPVSAWKGYRYQHKCENNIISDSAHHSGCVNYVRCKMYFSKSDCFVMSVFDCGIIA